MAKKQFTHTVDKKGKVTVSEVPQLTRHQKKSTQTLIPFTPGPKTVGQKLRRAWFS